MAGGPGAGLARDETGEVLGAVALRPGPAPGAELVGGARPGPGQAEAATGRACAFTEAHLVLAGPTPTASVEAPAGLRPLPLSGRIDPSAHLAALATYQDRIGHHTPAPEVGGFDPGLRHTGLRAALLLGGCALAQPARLDEVRVEGWGDTPGGSGARPGPAGGGRGAGPGGRPREVTPPFPALASSP